MVRKRRYRKELMENGTLVNPQGIEIAKVDLEEGIFIINERALYKYLLAGPYYGNQTPLTKINMAFGMTGGWTQDTTVDVVLRNMENLNLIEIISNEDGTAVAVKPLVSMQTANKKLPEYVTRVEQIAGLERLDDESGQV